MKNLLKIISIVLITTIFSCSKDETAPIPQSPVVANPITTVYVGGSQKINGLEKATIWKNGTPELLATETANASRVNSVYVVGTDVYAVGFEVIANVNKATLWKNGGKTTLSQVVSEAFSVAVRFNVAYIVGKSENKATLWTGEPALFGLTELNNTIPSVAKSIFLTDNGTLVNGIYIAGTSASTAWTFINNNIDVNFTNLSVAESIFARGNDVFVAVNNVFIGLKAAVLFKNGIAQNTIISNTAVLSVYGDEQNIYAVGSTNPFSPGSRATIWENYVPKPLSTKLSQANSVFVANKIVYVAGFEYDSNTAYFNATLWVNGVVQTLSTNDCNVKSVFVTVK